MTIFPLAQRPTLFGPAGTDRRGAAAVIADARQRQRRRRAIVGAAVAAAAVIVAAVLAFDVFLGRNAPVRQTSVRVYLDVGATPAETSSVLAAARAEHGVVSARVFSKRAALEALRRQYPALVDHLSGNPFPDSIDVQLTGGLDAGRLIADLKAKRLTGIARVRYITQK